MGMIGKMKRKDVDQVNDDFTDFSLSSPATKIRRLDADLPPIREEELEEPVPVTVPEPDPDPNEEKAIVVFNPLLHQYYHHQQHPNNNNTLSLSLSPDLISRFKDQFLRGSEVKCGDYEERKRENEEVEVEGRRGSCLAVVPWVPSQTQIPPMGMGMGMGSTDDNGEMETEEMEVEPVVTNTYTSSSNASLDQDYGLAVHHQRQHQQHQHQYWTAQPQQQHCLIPQPPPQNPFTTPITWTWSQ